MCSTFFSDRIYLMNDPLTKSLPKPIIAPFDGAKRDWKFLTVFILLSVVFWFVQFLYQYYYYSPQDLSLSLIRSFSLTGSTLVAFALLSSVIFKFRPRLAKYWYVRRAFGVMGFVFLSLHSRNVIEYLFEGNYLGIFFSLNPFYNPIIFGVGAITILFFMAITSFDWMVSKLTQKRWKMIHRFVYIALLFGLLHATLMNVDALMTPFGYLLIITTVLVLLGQLYWYIKISSRYNFRSTGTYIGAAIILLYISLIYYAFFR